MAGARPDIDRLIEEGLTLYGQGDLDGALLAWERVLALDPDNAQATSYVDYVRMNYEILTTEVAGDDGAPFAIAADDEPEYQIEILPGEDLGASGSAPMYIDPTDHGWALSDEPAGHSEPQLLVLEVDDPADASAMGMARVVEREPEPEPPPISFDDQTREYPGGPPAKKPDASEPQIAIEFTVEEPSASGTERLEPIPFQPLPDDEFHPEGTPGFGSELTPGFGFGEPSDYHTPPGGFAYAQNTPGFETRTGVRELNTGFVQPTKSAERKRPEPPELQMTLRTPEPPERQPAAAEPDHDDTDAAEDADTGLALELGPPDNRPRALTPPPADSPVELSYGSDDELDQPTVAQPTARKSQPMPVQSTTRDLPPVVRPPAPSRPPPNQPTTSTTRDFPPQKTDKLPTNLHFTVGDQPESYNRDPAPKPPTFANAELLGAPTRDLGLRPPGKPSNPEDDPTTQSDVRRFRAAVAASAAATQAALDPDPDPITARSAEILDAVDAGAPASEDMDDRTRRRITALVERATEWNRGGDHERAVAAIDLALSEDPNSALAQKLIHRNRDAIMAVFQSYLGDLERQPTLARPLHELGGAPISPRAAFLLSRIDGTLSLDEILDVSGMPRIEAYRYLCQLFLRGILR
ncbi:MAG TPA: hypothetical protein VFQ53_19680 [Kofleriaceae bacterium]|nr:hypothetical protein [Kofleriaceae bacterium]